MARGRPTPGAPRIVVFGNYGNGNLGDEATLQALLELLRARVPDAEVVAFAMNPTDTVARYGIEAEPAMRLAARASASRGERDVAAAPSGARDRVKTVFQRIGLLPAAQAALGVGRGTVRVLDDPGFELRRFRTLRKTDLFVIGGGGQLSEPIHVLSSLPLKVLKMTVLARVAGARVLVLDVGAVPLDRRFTRLVVAAVLRLAHYRSLRDELSRTLTGFGVRAPLDVYPDLAYGLDDLDHAPAAPDGRTVAINVFPHFDGRYLPAAEDWYRHYLDTLSSFTAHLLERGYKVVLFPTQLRHDAPAIADLKARLAALPEWATLRQQVIEPEVSTVGDVLDVLRSSDLVVATRFHGVLLALALGRPVLALASSPKTTQAMAEMGQAEFVFDANDAGPETLVAAFERLEAAREAIGADLRQRATANRASLVAQFDSLFGTVPNEPGGGELASGVEVRSGSRRSSAA